MNVGQLKAILKDLPDDMLVVIPNRSYKEIHYHITNGCNIVTTAGILVSDEEENGRVLCLNKSESGQDIMSQIKDPFITCEKILF